MNGVQSRSTSSSISSTRSGVHTPVPRDLDLKSTLLASLEISKEVKRLHLNLEAKVEEHESRFIKQEAKIKHLEEQVARIGDLEASNKQLEGRVARYEKLGEAFESMKATLERLEALQAQKLPAHVQSVNNMRGPGEHSTKLSAQIRQSSPIERHPHMSGRNGPLSPLNTSSGVNGFSAIPASADMSPSSSLSSSTSKRVSFAAGISPSAKVNGHSRMTNGPESIEKSDSDVFESDIWKPMQPTSGGSAMSVTSRDSELSRNMASSPSMTRTSANGRDGTFKASSSSSRLQEVDAIGGASGSMSAKHGSNGSVNDFSPTKSNDTIISNGRTLLPPTSTDQPVDLPPAILAELEELREHKSNAATREEMLKTEIKRLRSGTTNGVPNGKEAELTEREEKLEEMQVMLIKQHKRQSEKEKNLADWEARLAAREGRLIKAEEECQDHEIELDKRLKLVQKRERKIEEEEGIVGMRRKEPSYTARESAQFRKEQNLNAKAKDLEIRAEQVLKAERAYCQRTGEPFVPSL